jgi:hypothetical protein
MTKSERMAGGMNRAGICAGLACCLLLTGQAGRAAEPVPVFTGDNSYVNLSAPAALQIPGNAPFTVEGWVKFSTLSGYRMLYSKGNGRTSPYSYMFGVNGANQMVAHTGFGGDPVNTWQAVPLSPVLQTGQWVHLAWSFTGTSLRFYRNGQCVGVLPYRFDNNAAHTIKLGGYANANDIPGRMSDMQVWNAARDGVQIRALMHRRLGGVEPGLIGYWPLNEGSGTAVADGTGGTSDGTLVGASWQTDGDLTLQAAPIGYAYGGSFRLAGILTGSERFTNSNAVDLVDVQVPAGCDQFQMTESADPGSLGAWASTSAVPGTVTFAQPAADTNVILYAWFTNSAESVALLRAEAAIFFTGVAPVPVVRASFTIERMPGQPVVIEGHLLDAGSSGGSADGEMMALIARAALCADSPGCDATPEEPYVTLAVGTDSASLLLWLQNEAGTAIIGASTCTVTVVASTSGSTNRWTGAGSTDLWHDPANWSAGVPRDGQAARLTSGKNARLTAATAGLASFELAAGRTITVEGWASALQATNLTVAGTLTHADHLSASLPDDAGEWRLEHRIYLRGSNITIAAGATLNGDYLGYMSAMGPGGAGGTRDGGGHAGLGGVGATGGHVGGGAEYGNPVEPFQPGSGGADPALGGYGGGVIRIDADGHVSLAGTFSVNGRNAFSTHGAGGAGGSIWLRCRTFGGPATGLVRANGGNGNNQGGAGSAGRIALHYDPAAQAALAEPVPPVRFFGVPGTPGASVRTRYPAAMGTLYLPDTQFMTGTIVAQRLWHVRIVSPGFTTWTPDALTLNNVVIGLPAGFRLAVTNDLTLQNSARLHVFAAPVADPLTQDGGAVAVGGDLVLTGTTWIHPYCSDTNGASVGFTIDGDLSIAAGCGFDADALGYRWQRGPGVNTVRFSELGPSITIKNSSGAGHGGGGGSGWDCSGGGRCGEAGSPRLPGTGAPALNGARGGGVIRIMVGGHAGIDGTLTARGNQGNAHTQDGSSAGGSIRLDCRTFGGAATGLLRVDGDLARSISGAGGGGRIAVFYDHAAQAAAPLPSLRFSAAPGVRPTDSPSRGAEEGSLYFPDTLLVPALFTNGLIAYARLEIPGFTSWAPASLAMGAGEIVLPPGFNLDVAGDFTMRAGARLHLHAAPTNTPAEIHGARLTVGGNLRIENNAWLYPYAERTNGAVVGIRVAGDARIDAGGGIDAEGKGFTPKSTNLNGPGAGKNNASGGGYGGAGGGTAGGAVYGRAALPLEPGSPAGWYLYSNGLRSGQGGGAVRLLAGGTLRIDGTINANAMPKEPSYGGRGASGGSIFLAGQRLTGSGLLRANGSLNQGSAGADGGGGRIAVWVGVPLATVEASLASGSSLTAKLLKDYANFAVATQMEALAASAAAGNGSKGVYGRLGTVIQLR